MYQKYYTFVENIFFRGKKKIAKKPKKDPTRMTLRMSACLYQIPRSLPAGSEQAGAARKMSARAVYTQGLSGARVFDESN